VRIGRPIGSLGKLFSAWSAFFDPAARKTALPDRTASLASRSTPIISEHHTPSRRTDSRKSFRWRRNTSYLMCICCRVSGFWQRPSVISGHQLPSPKPKSYAVSRGLRIERGFYHTSRSEGSSARNHYHWSPRQSAQLIVTVGGFEQWVAPAKSTRRDLPEASEQFAPLQVRCPADNLHSHISINS
jgi:hypothetical protein